MRPIVSAAGNLASAEYFESMGISLRSGRSFRSGDLRGTPAVVVSERLATTLFGDGLRDALDPTLKGR